MYNEELEDAIEDGYFKSFIKKLMNVSTAYSLSVIHNSDAKSGGGQWSHMHAECTVVLTPSSVQLCYCCLIKF